MNLTRERAFSPRGRNELISAGRPPSEQPSHPTLAAALLMIGIVAFLVVVSVYAVAEPWS